MRRTLLAAAFVAATLGGLGAGTASAYCDPDYRPLCLNDCMTQLPDLHDPLGTLVRACPR